MPGTIYNRNGIWWIGFYHKGKQYRVSAKTTKKREAENLLVFYMSQVARGEFRGFTTKTTLTMTDLFDDLLQDCTDRGLRAIKTMNVRLRVLRKGLGDVDPTALTEQLLDLYLKQRRKSRPEGIKPATLNCEMSYIHQALKLAQRKRLIDKIPHIPHLKVKNARQGFLDSTEFERILACLPDYLQDFARFGYTTGWRRKEICTLEWRDIQEGVIRLRPEVSKNSEGRVLVLVGTLADIIERRQALRHEIVPYVFHKDGQRISLYNKGWKRAAEKACLPDKLFHDLRRTAVRNMIRAGVPERIAMAISGHKTRSMFDRYNIVNEEDIKQGLIKTETYMLDRKVLPFRAQSNHT